MFLGHRLTHRSGRQALAALAKSKGMLSNIRHQQLQHDLLDAVDGFFLDDPCSGRLSLQSLQHRMLGKIALAVPRAGNGGEKIYLQMFHCCLLVLRCFSLQAVIVVVFILALMLLALAAFKLRRKVVYAQQIA